MNKKLVLLAVVLALQLTWILATTVTHEYGLATGKLILLETRPVDPRDLLRGDYVILRYAINDILTDRFQPSPGLEPPSGKRVYVALKPEAGFYRLSRASFDPIRDLAPEEVLLCGTSETAGRWNSGQSVHIEYGLERYYVPEGGGNPQGKLTVEVAVSPSGKGKIKQVYVDGIPYLEAVPANK